MKPAPTLNERKMLRYVLQGVALGAAATVLVLAFTVRARTVEQLRHFSASYLALFFCMVVLAWLCNGGRVWLMCRAAGHRLRYRQSIAVSLSTEFGIAATPAGVGGTVIRLTLLRQAGVPLTTAGSLIATDAAVDMAFFTLLAPFAVYVLLHDAVLRSIFANPSELDTLAVFAALLAVVAGLILLLRSAAFHRAAARLAGATAFGRRRRLAARHRFLRIGVARALRHTLTSFAFLWRNRKGALVLNFMLASVQWSCRYLLLPLILLSLGTKVHPLPLFLVQGLLFAISLLVVVPGGGGSVELLTAFILPNIAPSAVIGIVVLVWRFFTYHLYILGGGAVFFYTCHRMNRLFPQAAPAQASSPPPAASRQS